MLPQVYYRLWEEVRTTVFLRAVTMGIVSGLIGFGLHQYDAYVMDQNQIEVVDPVTGTRTWVDDPDSSVLQKWVPDEIVLNVFTIFCALVATLRTSHALNQYQAAAGYLQMLRASWYDAASTIFAFVRLSKASPLQVQNFKQTLVRTLSLVNGCCLHRLSLFAENNEDMEYKLHNIFHKDKFHFKVLSPDGLEEEFLDSVEQSGFRPELILYGLQALVVDAINDQVISVPPPIITRSFVEINKGYEVYCEAKRFACIAFPFAYIFFGYMVLVSTTFITPTMLAVFCKGPVSSFIFSFGSAFLLWFLNGVADIFTNPYGNEARLLDTQTLQQELNNSLTQLLASDACSSDCLVPNFPKSFAGQQAVGEVSLTVWESKAFKSQQS